MALNLHQILGGIDLSNGSVARLFDVVDQSDDPWQNCREVLAQCYLLIACNKLSDTVPNATSRIAAKLYHAYDR